MQAHYDNYTRIRFRADMVRDERVFFGKVPSQIRKWRERGGCLVSWRRIDGKEGENDAILFAECPKSMDSLHSSIGFTAHLAVIYAPPTWRAHDATIAERFKDRPNKMLKATRRLDIMKAVVAEAPELTLDYLTRRFSRLAPSQPSPAPESPEGAARPSDIAH